MLVKKVKAIIFESDSILLNIYYSDVNLGVNQDVKKTHSLKNVRNPALQIEWVEFKTASGEFILFGESKVVKKRDGRLVLESKGTAQIYTTFKKKYILDNHGSYIRVI